MPNTPEDFKSKLEPKPEKEQTEPELVPVPITDKRILGQYDLIEEAQEAARARMNVLLGMVAMIQPEGAQFDYEQRAFMVPVKIEEENGESDEQEDE